MTRLIVFAWLVFSVAGAAGDEPDFSAYKGRIKGPPVMFGITAKCDNARLAAIESSLKPGEKKVFFYQYTILLNFENHEVSFDLAGMQFSKSVRNCILDGFARVSRPRGELPESGQVPVEIAFPAVITPRSGGPSGKQPPR